MKVHRPTMVYALSMHTSSRPNLFSGLPSGRGLYLSTFRLNLSAFCGIESAFRGWLRCVWEVLEGIRGH